LIFEEASMAEKTRKKQAACPACGGLAEDNGSGFFRCPKCLGVFDDDPDEGGDYSTDPSRRLEREDERRAAKGHVRRRMR
jgi:tRNA(Ile2) C34 agmatinyltransferase TiaS